MWMCVCCGCEQQRRRSSFDKGEFTNGLLPMAIRVSLNEIANDIFWLYMYIHAEIWYDKRKCAAERPLMVWYFSIHIQLTIDKAWSKIVYIETHPWRFNVRNIHRTQPRIYLASDIKMIHLWFGCCFGWHQFFFNQFKSLVYFVASVWRFPLYSNHPASYYGGELSEFQIFTFITSFIHNGLKFKCHLNL